MDDALNKDMVYCPLCGSNITGRIDYCPACGNDLSTADKKANAVRKSTAYDYMFIFGFILVFTVIFIIGWDRPAVDGLQSAESSAMSAGIGDMDEILANLPQDYDKLVELGNKFMDNHHFQVAIECYHRALAIDSADADVVCDLGSCLHATADFDAAIAEFEKALRMDSTHAIAYFNLGIVYRGMDNKEKAKYYWERLITLYPEEVLSDTARKYIERLNL